MKRNALRRHDYMPSAPPCAHIDPSVGTAPAIKSCVDPANDPLRYRAVEAIRNGRLGVVFVRQSGGRQRRRNRGSGREQRSQVTHLEAIGIPNVPEYVLEIDARGESGRRGSKREKFLQLLDLVRAGRVGCLLVVKADRMGRNYTDSSLLLDLLAEQRVIVLADGTPYDPADPQQRFNLQVHLSIAAYENDARADYSARTKMRKAMRLEYRIPLPTGLVWADPSDETYVRRLAAAGRADRLEPAALAADRTRATVADMPDDDMGEGHAEWPNDVGPARPSLPSSDEEPSRDESERDTAAEATPPAVRGRVLVLPFPDREVLDALELTVRWMQQLGSVTQVMRRIQTGADGWPHGRHGLFPATPVGVFTSWMRPAWTPVRRERLHSWLRNPAVYGRYVYASPHLDGRADRRDLPAVASFVDAFPSFAAPDLEAIITALLANPDGRWRPGARWAGARNHALPLVRCGHRASDAATPCGARLHVQYQANGAHGYRSIRCIDERAHETHTPGVVDRVVLDVLADAFDGDALRRLVERVRVHGGGTPTRARTQELAAARDVVAGLTLALGNASRAVAAEEPGATAVLTAVKRQLTVEARRLETLETAATRWAADAAALGTLRETDLAIIRRVAGSLRELLARAAAVDARAAMGMRSEDAAVRESARAWQARIRDVVGTLVSAVWVRREGGHYEVEVEFPTGARRVRRFFVDYPHSTDAERLYAFAMHARAGIPAAEVARAMTRINVARSALAPGRHPAPAWTADRVRGAAQAVELAGGPPVADARHATAPELAAKIGTTEEEVLARAFAGKLGEAALRSGMLTLAADEALLERAFTDYARSRVATREGWSRDDTVLLSDLRAELGLAWRQAQTAAARGANARDLAGRVWTRRSRAAVTLTERFAQALEAAPPAVRQLERDGWIPLREAPSRVPGRTVAFLARTCPTIRHGDPIGFVWVHLTPARIDELAKRTLVEAVEVEAARRGSAELNPRDFVRRDLAIRNLHRRFGLGHLPRWLEAIRAGRVLQVRATATADRSGPLHCFVHVPATVRDAEDAAVPFAWFGRTRPPFTRHDRRSATPARGVWADPSEASPDA